MIHNRFDMSLQVKLVSATIRVDDDPFSKNVKQSLEEGPLRHFRARQREETFEGEGGRRTKSCI